MPNWTFFWTDIASSDFEVCGIPFNNGNNFKVFKSTGAYAEVIDPIYGGKQKSTIYSFERSGSIYRVTYREWTPGVYGAHMDDATLPFVSPDFVGILSPRDDGSGLIKP